MQIKSILAAAAIALAASVGSASAAEQFSTLEGITAEALTPQEMGIVVGASLFVDPVGTAAPGTVNPLMAPGFNDTSIGNQTFAPAHNAIHPIIEMGGLTGGVVAGSS